MSEISGYSDPIDINELDEIVLFDGDGDLIEFYREGKYIYLEKPSNKKVKYRFNLQDQQFERMNFYKTVEDKITPVRVENITSWFLNCRIVTKDLHFGRLAVFAKYNRKFDRFSSPVRFIEQLGSSYISNIEKWESLGFMVYETYEFFGECQIHKGEDNRKAIFDGSLPRDPYYMYTGYLMYSPEDFTKNALSFIRRHHKVINNGVLKQCHSHYNNGEDIIEEELLKLFDDPEFRECFDFTKRRYGREETKHLFMQDQDAFSLRIDLIKIIKEFNLDLYALFRWLKRQIHVEKNDLLYLLDTHHYRDYLRCEYELKNNVLSKMVKYPKNFRSEFHKVQVEYMAKKAEIDRRNFFKLHKKHADLYYKDKNFQITIPHTPEDIDYEAEVLGHCVRSYITQMAEGETLILFLRTKDNPTEPYVTLEVKDNILSQAYGIEDSKPTKEALWFLKDWLKKKKIQPGCWRHELNL